MKSIYAVPLLALLSGCAHFDSADQIESMADLSQNFVATDPSGSTETLSPREYLNRYSAVLISDPNADTPSRPEVSAEIENETNLQIHLKWNGVRNDQTMGSAVPVSNDGYFLTAAHVVEDGYIWILHTSIVPGEIGKGPSSARISVEPIEVVYANRKADFAIIKTNIETPNYLKTRKTPLRKGELLFSGGVHNETGAGRYMKTHILSGVIRRNGDLFNFLQTTIPILPGDSGSPVIDTDGRLCGIATSTIGKTSEAVLLRSSDIFRIIETHRAANKS